MEDYYASGVLKYKSVTKIYGSKKDEFGVFGKTKVRIWEYYENGRTELVQKSVEKPAFGKRNETTGQPMNKLPNIRRRFKKFDRGGARMEKGWETSRRSKNVQYDTDVYRKVIVKKNQKWRTPKKKYYERFKRVKKAQIQLMEREVPKK